MRIVGEYKDIIKPVDCPSVCQFIRIVNPHLSLPQIISYSSPFSRSERGLCLQYLHNVGSSKAICMIILFLYNQYTYKPIYTNTHTLTHTSVLYILEASILLGYALPHSQSYTINIIISCTRIHVKTLHTHTSETKTREEKRPKPNLNEIFIVHVFA